MAKRTAVTTVERFNAAVQQAVATGEPQTLVALGDSLTKTAAGLYMAADQATLLKREREQDLARERAAAAAEAPVTLLRPIDVTLRVVPNEKGNPPGKLADIELHFTGGLFEGLKLIGFSIWERRTGTGRNVTFPARQYSVNGERRSFALLRPSTTAEGQDRVRDYILEQYAVWEAQDAEEQRRATEKAMGVR